MIKLSDPITKLHRIGDLTAAKLRRLDIESVEDLISHLPIRYEDLSIITPIAELKAGEPSTVRGTVEKITTHRSPRKRMMITEVRLRDDSGLARAVWFHQPYLEKTLRAGEEIFLSGKANKNLLEAHFINPVYEKVKAEQLHTAHVVPFYPLTGGVTQKQIRFLIYEALKNLGTLPDELPSEVRLGEHLPARDAALRQIHFPKNKKAFENAIRRLKFEELFWAQLGAAYARRDYEQRQAPAIRGADSLTRSFTERLPFILTRDQKQAVREILGDIAGTQPMNRLLEGDVGSGKTVVAAIALNAAAHAGYQSVLMAPTEILALQHYRELQKLLPGIKLALLTSKQHYSGTSAADQRTIVRGLANGAVQIAVGTHSLIQEGVAIPRLALAVIDEQHRFGVEQRERLTSLSGLALAPHLLSLSATPIPRTLALTLYGDLAITTLREKPRGRKPVMTRLIPESKRNDAYGFIRKQAQAGQQTFILCPLIEDDEDERKAVLSEYTRLKGSVLPDLEMHFMHGKLKSEEKKKILEDFKNNRFPILVSTSVIEVGIDIPNATVMLIEGAERFGLAQLHQFRGRVGRNDLQSYCLLFAESLGAKSSERLKYFCTEQDGFALAEADLKIRGEGELFGTRQSGLANFKIATIHDTDLIERSRRWVDAIVQKDTESKFYKSVEHKLTATTRHGE